MVQRFLLVFAVWVLASISLCLGTPARVIVIRHAEKPEDPRALHLSPAGEERAKDFVAFLKNNTDLTSKGLPIALFATQKTKNDRGQRTRETLEPLSLDLDIAIQLPYKAENYERLAKQILSTKEYEGKTVLICWTHEYIPQLVSALGVHPQPERLSGDVYDRVYVVDFKDGEAHLQETRQGTPSPQLNKVKRSGAIFAIMRPFKHYFKRRLTTLQGVLATLCVILLAWLGYLVVHFLSVKSLQRKVDHAFPLLVADIRIQRADLVRAIEDYKSKYGFYPKDHVVSRNPLVVDAVTNPLLYELAGVLYNPTNSTFALGHLEPADAGFVKAYFNCDGFTNSSTTDAGLNHFLSVEGLPFRQLHDDPDVFVASFSWDPTNVDEAVFYEVEIGSWRYVSTSPTNNPKSYDLWIEVRTRNRILTVGNWKDVD